MDDETKVDDFNQLPQSAVNSLSEADKRPDTFLNNTPLISSDSMTGKNEDLSSWNPLLYTTHDSSEPEFSFHQTLLNYEGRLDQSSPSKTSLFSLENNAAFPPSHNPFGGYLGFLPNSILQANDMKIHPTSHANISEEPNYPTPSIVEKGNLLKTKSNATSLETPPTSPEKPHKRQKSDDDEDYQDELVTVKKPQRQKKDRCCTKCGKYFTTSGHLARHMRIHDNFKPFNCTIPGCLSKFSRKDNCDAHIRSHQKRIERRFAKFGTEIE